MDELLECDFCERKWPMDSEQAISIEMFGQCIVCKFTPIGRGSNDGTNEQLQNVSDEYLIRLVKKQDDPQSGCGE